MDRKGELKINRRAWSSHNPLRTGHGKFNSKIYKWMADASEFYCGAEKQDMMQILDDILKTLKEDAITSKCIEFAV